MRPPPLPPSLQWLLERPLAMQAAMLKPAGQPNAMLDTSVLPKLCGGEGRVHLAGARSGGGRRQRLGVHRRSPAGCPLVSY